MAKVPGPSKAPKNYTAVAPEGYSRRLRKENLQGSTPPKPPASNAVTLQKANSKV